MKHIFIALFALIAMANNANSQVSDLILPKTAIETSLNIAVNNKFITQQNADLIVKSGVINKAFDAFINSGFSINATIDKIADIAVEEKIYTGREKAKKDFGHILSRCLNNKDLHKRLFHVLGLEYGSNM